MDEGELELRTRGAGILGPMNKGELELKVWGTGFLPQAQLLFDSDLLLKDQYLPLVSYLGRGTRLIAHRCKVCRIVCFGYGDHPA
jgi:hypothetical protein